MKSQRYGCCKTQHAGSTIRSAIRDWAKERELFDGIVRSKIQIEEIVEEQYNSTIKGDGEDACQWLNCEREFVR